MSQLFTSDDQITGALASILPRNIQGWSPSRDWPVWSPYSPRGFLEPSPAPQFKGINSLASAFFMVQLSQPYMTTGKTTTLSIGTLTIQTSSTLIIHKKLKTKRTIPLRIIQNPNVILYRKSETYYWWREYLFWTGPSSIKEQRIWSQWYLRVINWALLCSHTFNVIFFNYFNN